jgi:hypothetical protein
VLARGGKVAGSTFQHSVQIEKICIVRGLCKKFASQGHGGLVFRIEDQHTQINALGLDIAGIAPGQLLCNLFGLFVAHLFDVYGHER